MKRSEYERLVAEGEPESARPARDAPAPQRWLKVCLGLLIGLVVVSISAVVVLQLLARAVVNAPSINCVNNLKTIHLNASVWALNHQVNVLPNDLLSLTNELGSLGPSVLHCPADHDHPRPSAWSDLSTSNISYRVVTPGALDGSTNEYITCNYHPNVILANGRILRGAAR
jgi:hypothetical protein